MALANVRRGCAFQLCRVGRSAALGKPSFDFGEIPHDAARAQVEATREFAAALHLVDRRVRERHDLPKFGPSNGDACVGARLSGAGAELRGISRSIVQRVTGEARRLTDARHVGCSEAVHLLRAPHLDR